MFVVLKAAKDIDVLGVCLRNVYDGFGPFRTSASRVLLANGLGRVGAGKLAEFDAEAWYPLDRFLEALVAISSEAGDNVLFGAGLAVPANVVWPPHVIDVYSALESIDVAFHMNHGRRGAPLFDPATGKMGEGIGHYRANRAGDFVQMTCENPYPCIFDRGLITAVVKPFIPKARVQHVEFQGCRNLGGPSCSYDVTW